MYLRSAPSFAWAFVFSLAASTAFAELFLPGTQPRENDILLGKVDQCILCHSNTKNGPADPYASWVGGMMAQAARDPVFRAALAVANQDIEGIGEFCLRCHAPRGWVEGRSAVADGSALIREDLHGVSCDLCHHLVDPVSTETKTLAKNIPPGYGNAMMIVDDKNLVRGPYADVLGPMPHRAVQSAFFARSELCGVCHNTSNPDQAADVRTQPPYAFGTIERTWSEWQLSDFPKRGAKGQCQYCHYPQVEGGGYPARFGERLREHYVWHGPVGGSVWVRDAIWQLWTLENVNQAMFDTAKDRTRKLLRTAATLDLSFPDAKKGRLRITNLTGHKLPTGYPEGRRMWINLRFLDSSGKVVKEIGQYGEKNDVVLGQAIAAPTLLDPDQTRVYECLPAISEAAARKHNKQPGPSFHFVLNDVIAKDNRIPPEGFKQAAFVEHLSQPVGANYADGQYWDDFDFAVPDGAARVAVRLMYQSVSWEYIRFLANEDKKDDWGKKLYQAWSTTGKCPPDVIAELTRPVGSK